jgi:hydrogenase maturation protease
MNQPMVDRLVGALLYEGYLLYPYRPSVKNRQRWSFGGLYPPSYTAGRVGADASAMRTQCLATGSPQTLLTASVRFLHLVSRLVGELDAPRDDWPIDPATPVRFVESLRVVETTIHSWQEAIERTVAPGEVKLGDLAATPRRVEFGFGPGSEREPIRAPGGAIVGFFERRQRRVEGVVELSAEPVGEGVYRLTVGIENRTGFEAVNPEDRDEVLLHTLVSTHTILAVREGSLVSSLDPPKALRGLSTACQNVGTWPVLVGADGDSDMMLSSPIILYDYPQIAPESPGDLFDSTEIDEILTLRIMTLSDEEKRTMAALDGRGNAILERTEAMARGELMGLHSTFREFRPVSGGPNHGSPG